MSKGDPLARIASGAFHVAWMSTLAVIVGLYAAITSSGMPWYGLIVGYGVVTAVVATIVGSVAHYGVDK